MDVGFHLFGNLTPLSLAARALKWVLVAVVCVSQRLGQGSVRQLEYITLSP